MAADIGRLLVVFLFLFLIPIATAARNLVSSQNLEVQEHLKRLNKPPIKSIQSPDGDIIDCIHAAHQPAFDHPLLKKHDIQMKPSFYPAGLYEEAKVVSSNEEKKDAKHTTQLWHLNGTYCPDGTVAIRRTKEDDILRASSVEEFGKKKRRTIPQPSSTTNPAVGVTNNHEYGIVREQGDTYYGAKATINLWQPNVQQPTEFSLSQLWITAGSYQTNDLNTIEVGWQAYPRLYGDSNPRLFTYWTSDAYETTGCYNLACSGFVQTSNKMAIGASLGDASVYGGSQQDITVLVFKDQSSGNWWLKLGDEDVGYWPSSLYTNLQAGGGSKVEWGGEVVNQQANGQHTTTEMGSGHLSEEGYGKASYFKNIQTVDATNNLREPSRITLLADHPTCYNVQNGNSADMGTYFYYGGPGRNPNCP